MNEDNANLLWEEQKSQLFGPGMQKCHQLQQ
jgi:hypothetical protein